MSYSPGFTGYWFHVSQRMLIERELYSLNIAGEQYIKVLPLEREATEVKYQKITSAETIAKDSSGFTSNKNMFDELFIELNQNPFESKALDHPHSTRQNGFDIQFSDKGVATISRVESSTAASWTVSGAIILKPKKTYV